MASYHGNICLLLLLEVGTTIRQMYGQARRNKAYGRAIRNPFSTLWDSAIDVIKSSPIGKRLSIAAFDIAEDDDIGGDTHSPAVPPFRALGPVDPNAVLLPFSLTSLSTKEPSALQDAEFQETSPSPSKISDQSDEPSVSDKSSLTHSSVLDSSFLIHSAADELPIAALASFDSPRSIKSASSKDIKISDLENILHIAKLDSVQLFETFASNFTDDCGLSKIGEASYSEVYAYIDHVSGSKRVIKIIPMAPEQSDISSSISDVFQEASIAKELSQHSGYVDVTS